MSRKHGKPDPFREFVRSQQVHVYATYSEITGRQYDMTRLPAMVRGLPFVGVLSMLSQLTSLRPNDPKAVRVFASTLEDSGMSADAMRLDSRYLYSTQGILSAWKWMLAYGNPSCESDGTSVDVVLSAALLLCLIVSDSLRTSDVPIEYELLRNAVFNSGDSTSARAGRAYLMYIKLASQKELFNHAEYLDIHADFRAKYGFDLVTYLTALFGLSARIMTSEGGLTTDWGIRPEVVLRLTSFKDIAPSIIEPLTFDLTVGRTWALRTIDTPWDYSLIQEKPLFLASNGLAIPVSVGHLYSQFFDEAFYWLRRCYPDLDRRFLTFMGRVFEVYVSRLAVESLKGLPGYQVIPEFPYGPGNCSRSPDVMIRMRDSLLAVEAKSRSMKRESYTLGTPTSVDQELTRLVTAPLTQLHDRIRDLRNMGHPSVQGVRSIYLMAVTLGGFPTLPPFEAKAARDLERVFSFEVKSWFHLDIREFELLMSLVSARNHLPLFRILDRKAAQAPYLDFLNYLFAAGHPLQPPDCLKQAIEEFLAYVSGRLFPENPAHSG
jgi:hypothetical protein